MSYDVTTIPSNYVDPIPGELRDAADAVSKLIYAVQVVHAGPETTRPLLSAAESIAKAVKQYVDESYISEDSVEK